MSKSPSTRSPRDGEDLDRAHGREHGADSPADRENCGQYPTRGPADASRSGDRAIVGAPAGRRYADSGIVPDCKCSTRPVHLGGSVSRTGIYLALSGYSAGRSKTIGRRAGGPAHYAGQVLGVHVLHVADLTPKTAMMAAWLDRIIRVFAPRVALRRKRARQELGRLQPEPNPKRAKTGSVWVEVPARSPDDSGWKAVGGVEQLRHDLREARRRV